MNNKNKSNNVQPHKENIINKNVENPNNKNETKVQDLLKLNKELVLQNKEKEKREDELIIANEVKSKLTQDILIANKELVFQNKKK